MNIISIVIGTIALIATIWNIILFVRSKYPGQITYVKEFQIGLFDSIVKYLPELSILYNEKPINEGLVLLKGALLNTGSKDITTQMILTKLKFSLPESYSWVMAKITKSSQDLNADIIAQDRDLIFSMDAFRKNEYLEFQAIAEAPISTSSSKGELGGSIESRLNKAISITHRIIDTQKVMTFDLPSKEHGKKRMTQYLILAIVTTLALIALLITSYFQETNYISVNEFIINDTKGIPHEIRIKPQSNGKIILKGINDNFYRELTLNEFNMLSPKIIISKFSTWSRWLSIPSLILIVFLYIIAPWYKCIKTYKENKKAKTIRSLIAIIDSDNDKKQIGANTHTG